MEDTLDATTVPKILKDKGGKLGRIDSSLQVDVAFWEASQGRVAEQRVRDMLLAMLPDAGSKKDISTVKHQCDELLRGKLVAWAGKGATTVSQVDEYIVCMGDMTFLSTIMRPHTLRARAMVPNNV